MKKYLYVLFMIIVSIFIGDDVQALTVYSSTKNTYYQRSQHTYAWHDLEGYSWQNFAPALYIMYKDYDDAAREEDWNFDQKYTRPWTPDNDSYFLTLCADLIYDFWPVKTYNVVSLADSTYLKDEIKANLNGIVKHSYPFISEDEMVSELVKNGVLVETENKTGEKIYTAKKNVDDAEELQYTINKDELLSAAQMAVYYYTDRDKVDSVYYGTAVLSTNFSVLDRSALYDEGGTYNVVKNNIEAIYNYLINLKDDSYYKPVTIKKIVTNSKNEVLVKLSNKDSIQDLKLVVKNDSKTIKEVNVKDLDKDAFDNYIIPLKNKDEVNKAKVILTGTVAKDEEVLVFEALNGAKESQTLIGYAKTDIPIYTGEVKSSLYVKPGDITLEKEADKDFLSAGDTFNYIIKVKNNSSYDIDDISVTDEVNSNLEVVDTKGVVDNNNVVWKIALKAGEEKRLKVKVKVKDNVKDGNIPNTVKTNYYNIGGEASMDIAIVNNPDTNGGIIAISLGTLGILMGLWFFVRLRKNKLYRI